MGNQRQTDSGHVCLKISGKNAFKKRVFSIDGKE